MELRHLRYFVAVAETENVSRAALKLHVSQPGVSQQIRDLEEELGVQLLERTAKPVRLTEPGRAFFEDARTILKNANDAMLRVRNIAGTLETILRVGDWPQGTGRIMPALLKAYQGAMPNVHVKLHDWRLDEKIAGARRVVLLVRRFRCGRGGEFLEARIVPERIEHRIEPEQSGRKRHA